MANILVYSSTRQLPINWKKAEEGLMGGRRKILWKKPGGSWAVDEKNVTLRLVCIPKETDSQTDYDEEITPYIIYSSIRGGTVGSHAGRRRSAVPHTTV